MFFADQWTSVPRSGEVRENYDESSEEVRCGFEGARWSSGINAANGASGSGSRPVYYLSCSDLGQVVNLSLSVA